MSDFSSHQIDVTLSSTWQIQILCKLLLRQKVKQQSIFFIIYFFLSSAASVLYQDVKDSLFVLKYI